MVWVLPPAPVQPKCGVPLGFTRTGVRGVCRMVRLSYTRTQPKGGDLTSHHEQMQYMGSPRGSPSFRVCHLQCKVGHTVSLVCARVGGLGHVDQLPLVFQPTDKASSPAEPGYESPPRWQTSGGAA